MPIKIQIQITEKDIFDFLLYHNYSRFSGIFGTVVGVFALGMGITYIVNGNIESSLILIIMGLFLLVYTPRTLKAKAKTQAKEEMFQHPLEYEFSEKGITTRQGEQEITNEWDAYEKAVSTRNSVILYMNRVRAMIFPKRCIGDQYEEVLKLIHTHMPPKKVKIRHIH